MERLDSKGLGVPASLVPSLATLVTWSIFRADSDKWQRQRKTAGFEFHSAKFQKMIVDSLFKLVHARLLPVLEDSIKQLAPIDLQDVLMRLTFDNVCMITFGVDPGCLQPGLPKIPFAQAFEEATEGTLIRFCGPMCVWKAMTYFAERKLQMSIISERMNSQTMSSGH
ncbi:hypothetical protein ACFXTI_039914 [Malus domestica]